MSERKITDFFIEEDCDTRSSVISESTGREFAVRKSISVEAANQILNEYLKTCPVVYGKANESYDGDFRFHDIGPLIYVGQPEKSDTHKAFLVGVERIKEE